MADAVQSIGLGTTAWIDDGASSAYVQIFNLVSVTPPAPKLGLAESKTLSGGTTVKKIPTLFEAGEVSIKQQFTNAGFARVETLRKAKTASHVKVVITDESSGTTIIAPGLFTQNKTDSLEADKINEFESLFELTDATT